MELKGGDMRFVACGKGFAISAMSIGFLVSSCGQTPTDSSSQLHHATGEIVRSSDAWNWIKLSGEDFEDKVLANLRPGASYLDDDHELVERSQHWIDAIDRELRKKYPEKLQHVPKPFAKVMIEKSANAFVSPAFVCYNKGLKFSGQDRAADKVFFDLRHGKFFQFPDEFKCIEGKDPRQFADAVAAFNKASEDCKLKESGASYQVSEGCDLEKSLQTKAGAKVVAIPQTANWLTIHSSLYTFMEEERAFVGVIAHELGHYYRSHTTSLKGEYDFYYEIGERNLATKPVADESLQEIGERVYMASKIYKENKNFQRIPGQKISSELYLAAGDLALQSCSTGSCPRACKVVASIEDSGTFQKGMSFYPFTPAENQDLYENFEEVAVSCLNQLSYSESGFLRDLSWENVQTAILAPRWIPFKSQMSMSGVEIVSRSLFGLAKRIDKVTDADSALDVIMQISESLSEQQHLSESLLSRARHMKLGQYTSEQEADEQSIEMLAMIGFNADAAVDTYMALAKGEKDGFAGGMFGEETCSSLRENGWKNENGEDVFVPIGDYSEVHHSACFRAYNASREIVTHAYDDASKEPQAPGMLWASIQDEVSLIEDANRSDGSTEIALSAKARDFLKVTNAFKGCVFQASL